MLPQYRKAILEILGHPKNIGILGYGQEGRSSHRILRELYPDTTITVYDQNEVKQTNYNHDHYITGPDYRTHLNKCDVLLRSPGIKLGVSEYTGHVTSQVDIFTKACRERIIGVTGTKGKSTTVTLIHHLLSQHFKTALVGNIGTPVLECLFTNYDYYVCEYSCHQLSDISASPKYAVLLNLFPEHLDYYDTLSDYYATKRNIYNFQVEGDHLYSITGIKNGALVVSIDETINVNGVDILAGEQFITINGNRLKYAQRLTGRHNKLNQAFAVAVAIELGVPVDSIARGLTSFTGLPHRLEAIDISSSLSFINDSISTIPQSTIAAMQSFADLKVVMIGGFDRGIDYEPLVAYLNKNTKCKIVLFSDVGKRISEELIVGYSLFATFADATDFVLELEIGQGTVLMSPGASSYDEFQSFVHRGNFFKDRVVKHFSK